VSQILHLRVLLSALQQKTIAVGLLPPVVRVRGLGQIEVPTQTGVPELSLQQLLRRSVNAVRYISGLLSFRRFRQLLVDHIIQLSLSYRLLSLQVGYIDYGL
jgi:hypothetical protein